MNRRERLENTIAGHPTDHIPVTLWRHFPGDDQRVADLATSVLAFQQTYDWDVVVVQPASTYTTRDYGALPLWDGSVSGDTSITNPVVGRSLAWTELPSLDPQRGETGKIIEAVRLIVEGLQDEQTPVVFTLYSPLAQAARLTTQTLLQRNLRTHPDRLQSGLNIITDNTLRLINALKRTHIAGIRYVIEHADYDHLSEAEYRVFGIPYDRKILSEFPTNWWFNMLSVQADAPMFPLIQDYPVHAVNWKTHIKPNIPQGKSLIRGAVAGGIPSQMLLTQSPNIIKEHCREAVAQANGRRILLTSDSPFPLSTPLSNLRAMRNAAKTALGGN